MSSPAASGKTPEQKSGKVSNRVSNADLAKLTGSLKTRDNLQQTTITTIYSNPGVGKTKLAAELSNRNIFVTTETGNETLKYWPELDARSKFFRFDPDTGPADTLKLMQAIYYRQLACDNLVLDTLSGMNDRMVYKSLRTNDSNLFRRDSPDLPCQQDYGWAFQMLRPLLLAADDLAAIGCSVTINCHVRYPSDQDIKKGDTLARPGVQKALYDLANEQSNVVGYLYMDKGKRLIRTETDSTFIAKKRNRHMPDTMSVDKFAELLFNSKPNTEIKEA